MLEQRATPASLLSIIVSWNSETAQLNQTLASVERNLLDASKFGLLGSSMLHLWDNNSAVFSKPKLRTEGKLTTTRHFANLGFAAGNNAAAHLMPEADWLLLVNPDAMLAEESLRNLLVDANAHPEYSVFGFSLVSAEIRAELDGLGDVIHISGFGWRDGYSHPSSTLDSISDCYETFAICAAALLIRRDVFEAAGGFDEDFFCYQEDVDLGFRLRLMGHRAMQVPHAVVYHVGSQSTGGHRSDFSVYHGRRNLVWCYVKNMPGILFWLFLPLHLALNVVELIYFTFQGQGRVIWRAKLDAIKGLPKMWRKRQRIQSQRVASVWDIWQALDKRLWPWGFKSIRAKSGRRFGND